VDAGVSNASVEQHESRCVLGTHAGYSKRGSVGADITFAARHGEFVASLFGSSAFGIDLTLNYFTGILPLETTLLAQWDNSVQDLTVAQMKGYNKKGPNLPKITTATTTIGTESYKQNNVIQYLPTRAMHISMARGVVASDRSIVAGIPVTVTQNGA
jgi:hypothetical protein